MKLFRPWLRSRRRAAAAFFLCAALLAVSFALYRLPLAALLYPGALCLAVCLAFAAAGFLRSLRLHRQLKLLRNALPLLPGELPPAQSPEGEDYRELLRLLSEERLAFAEKTAAGYADMEDYYTAWVHQIKTPIASMRLRLQSEDTDSARQLGADLSRIEQYVNMVLTYLRLDSDTTDYVLRDCELDAIVRPAVRRFAGEFISRRLRLDYDELNVSVLTDEKWLGFVVGQVLSNALKYTSSGGVSIYLEEGPVLCIRDTGIGIAAEDLPRIFEKGYTGLSGRADLRATGIGLYLCRRICDDLGHTISAESAPGEGTVVRIGLGRERRQLE